jgi:hypothetical protein|tara:strand:- start:939 stop:1238 length:300 start_codon:yes stop_codon:yes gene_type:complete
MKIEKAQIIKSLMNVQKNPHTNNIINSQIDVVINQLIQTDSIECVFSKQSYLRSNLENKVVLSPETDFGFYHFIKETPTDEFGEPMDNDQIPASEGVSI